MAASLVTNIVLRGVTDPSLIRAFQTASGQAQSALSNLEKYGNLAKKAMTVAGGAIVAGLGTATQAAIEYESAFAGVQKTVNETDTTSYEDISNAIRNMAKEMPATTTEIAAVAEAAGQLGIKADDISKFTEVMINLGTTTNLSSEEAATAIAKMFNITGTSMSEVDRFGATIVALGNNAATTEADIVNMATRIASSASQIGMSETELLALATSLSSVGLEAEAGGTAISTVMTEIDKAVALNSDSIAIWAETAGMSTDKFKQAWENDAYGALQKIIGGMGDVKANGGNLNTLLEDLEITGIRTSDTMKRLSGASELMGNMTTLANTAWEENVALTNEANTRYATTESKIAITKNRLNDLAITIGEALLPAVNGWIDKIAEMDMDAIANKIVGAINWIIEHADGLKTTFRVVAGIFTAFKIGGFLADVNKASLAINNMYSVAAQSGSIPTLQNSLGSLGTNLATTFKNIGTTISATMRNAWTAIAGIGAPVWIAIGVIALLTAAFKHLWDTNEVFKNDILAIWQGIKDKFSEFGAGIVERINELGFNFESVGQIFSTAWDFLCNSLAPIIEAVFLTISNIIGGVLDFILGVVDVFIGLFTGDWEQCWTGIQEILMGAWNFITSAVQAVGTVLFKYCGDIIVAIVEWFKQLPSKIWTFLSETIAKAQAWGANMWAKAKEVGSNFINGIVTWFQQLPSRIGGFFSNVATKVSTWAINMGSKAKETGSNFITGIVTWFQQLPSRIWTFITNVATKVSTWGANLWAKAKEVGSNFINSIVTFFSELPYKIGYVLGYVVGTVAAFGVKLWTFVTTDIPKFVNGIVNFIKQLPSKIWTWLVNAYTKFVTWGAQIINLGITKAKEFVTKFIMFIQQLPSRIWTWLTNAYTKVVAWGTQIVTTAIAKAQQFLTSVVNFFAQLPSRIWAFLSTVISNVIAWGANIVSIGIAKAQAFLTSVVNFFSQLPAKIWAFLSNVISKVVSWGAKIVSTGIAKARQFLTSVVNFFRQLPSKIWTWLVNVVTKVGTWGINLVNKGKKAAQDLFNAIVNKVKEIPNKLLEIGKNIVEGLWKGISGAKDWLVGKISEFCGGFMDGFKSALGINSPSKITTGFGEFLGQGLGIGIDSTRGLVGKAVSKMNDLVINGFGGVMPTISPVIGAVNGNIPKYATGGTVTTPHAAIVGDAPETIVPHGNTPRNRALLNEAAAGVGANIGGSTVINVSFAPVINGGNAEENRQMLLEEEEAFERRMDEYFAKKGRLAFG